MNTELTQYQQAINHLLNKQPDAALMLPNCELLKDYLGDITGISAEFDMNDWDDVKTEQGVAISPVQAAKCAKETLRTQIFMQGVKTAIEERLTPTQNIHILYAGTGPYATLLLPYLSVIANPQIKATLIDIHPENITAIKKLIKHFSLEDNITDVICADATQWQSTNSQPFDIIISETMTALLKREPQVFIFAHLCQYLSASGTLIPQEVSLKTWLTPNKHNVLNKPTSKHDILLKEFYRLDRAESERLNQGDTSSFQGDIAIPEGVETGYMVKLTTDIQVYNQHKLTENQCSLNVPLSFLPYNASLRAGENIHYEYITPESADFVFTFPTKEIAKTDIELADFNELNRLGLPGIKRMFQQAQANKCGYSLTSNEEEWTLWTNLLDSLNLAYHDTTAALYQSESLKEFEQWVEEKSNMS